MDIDLDPDYYLGSQYYALLLVESSTLTYCHGLTEESTIYRYIKEMETSFILYFSSQNQLGRDHGNML